MIKDLTPAELVRLAIDLGPSSSHSRWWRGEGIVTPFALRFGVLASTAHAAAQVAMYFSPLRSTCVEPAIWAWPPWSSVSRPTLGRWEGLVRRAPRGSFVRPQRPPRPDGLGRCPCPGLRVPLRLGRTLTVVGIVGAWLSTSSRASRRPRDRAGLVRAVLGPSQLCRTTSRRCGRSASTAPVRRGPSAHAGSAAHALRRRPRRGWRRLDGIQPAGARTYSNGVRKGSTATPTATRSASAANLPPGRLRVPWREVRPGPSRRSSTGGFRGGTTMPDLGRFRRVAAGLASDSPVAASRFGLLGGRVMAVARGALRGRVAGCAVLLVLGGVAGCTSNAEPSPLPSPTSSPSPSQSSMAAAPPLPPEAEGTSPAAAKAFATLHRRHQLRDGIGRNPAAGCLVVAEMRHLHGDQRSSAKGVQGNRPIGRRRMAGRSTQYVPITRGRALAGLQLRISEQAEYASPGCPTQYDRADSRLSRSFDSHGPRTAGPLSTRVRINDARCSLPSSRSRWAGSHDDCLTIAR